MRKKKIDNTITAVRMVDRYRHINKFRYSIFAICNRATPMEVTLNPIMAEMVLNKLKELNEEIREDINSITIDSINAEDIFGSRQSGVSELLAMEVCMYDLSIYKSKYDKYIQRSTLEKIHTVEKIEQTRQKINRDINKLEECINELESVLEGTSDNEKKELEKLIIQKDKFEDKFGHPALELEVIETSLFIRITSYLNNILEDIGNRIEYLERGLA